MSFLYEKIEFTAFSAQHGIPIFIILFAGMLIILFARKYLDEDQQRYLGAAICIIPILAVFGGIYYAYKVGTYSHTTDLPLHLCRITAFISPFIMFTKNRKWLGVLYFWVLVGTLNANVTPDLLEGFPNLSYIVYFLLHTGLLIIPFYSIFVYGLRINFADFKRTFIYTNIYFVIIHGINYLLGSNYFYTMNKPPVASVLDLMGPWPWYILAVQGLALVLMLLAYLPFIFARKRGLGRA